jgi:putative peptidoglycan lipid II flippase
MSNNKSQSGDSHRSIIKSTGILALGTLSSRILGFIRDILLAKILGTGLPADALLVAFRIPNMFRDMVAEGACNSAVVPVISEYKMARNQDDFWRFISTLLLVATLILSLLTIFGVVFAPLIVRLIAPGFAHDSEKILLTVRLAKILFPYLIFIGLTAYIAAILNTFRHFLFPAFSPCVLNLAVIVGAIVSANRTREPVYGIAWSILIGGVLQLLMQLPPIKKTGIRWQLPRTLNHPGVIQIGKLLAPRLVGSGVYQLNIFIDTLCASLSSIIGPGGIAAIYFANRLIQFPIGVFGLALATAVLPTLSSYAAGQEIERLKKTLAFSLENIFLVMVPASIFMILLATPIIRVLFERGNFDQYSTMITASAVAFYALGLYSYGGVKILVTTFHSMQDTKTPVKVAAGCLVINAVLNMILMWPLKIGGIALASSIASSVNFFWLFALLERRVGPLTESLKAFFFKILCASLLMGAAIYLLWGCLLGVNEIVRLIVVTAFGFLFYGTLCYGFNIRQVKKILEYAFRKGKGHVCDDRT